MDDKIHHELVRLIRQNENETENETVICVTPHERHFKTFVEYFLDNIPEAIATKQGHFVELKINNTTYKYITKAHQLWGSEYDRMLVINVDCSITEASLKAIYEIENQFYSRNPKFVRTFLTI